MDETGDEGDWVERQRFQRKLRGGMGESDSFGKKRKSKEMKEKELHRLQGASLYTFF